MSEVAFLVISHLRKLQTFFSQPKPLPNILKNKNAEILILLRSGCSTSLKLYSSYM